MTSDRLAALSHPARMAVFRLLMRRSPDKVPAGEMAAALDLKPNTLSVYLGNLQNAGLITRTRRGRSLLYRVDLGVTDAVLQDLVFGLGRGRLPGAIPATEPAPGQGKANVLFVCTGNSARSIIA